LQACIRQKTGQLYFIGVYLIFWKKNAALGIDQVSVLNSYPFKEY
jgi:hypothetical protein